MSLASINGIISPLDQAVIPIVDEGFLRGDGAFEVARIYQGTPFAYDDHLQRLKRSCDGLRLAVDIDAVRAEADALLNTVGKIDALIRIVITRGGRRIAIIEDLPTIPKSLRVATIEYTPTGLLDGLKTLSYAANMLAGRIAKDKGFDEALFVTPGRCVLEGPTWSLFWAESNRLYTPPIDDQILASITRGRLLEELSVEEETCSLERLANADEAFLASTVREVTPISAIDQIKLPSVQGPLTLEARDKLRRRIEHELSPVTTG